MDNQFPKDITGDIVNVTYASDLKLAQISLNISTCQCLIS